MKIHRSPSLVQASAKTRLAFRKDGHFYAFVCPKGGELGLISALLSTALDPRLNLDLDDVRGLIDLHRLAMPSKPKG